MGLNPFEPRAVATQPPHTNIHKGDRVKLGRKRNGLLDVEAMRGDYAAGLYREAFERIEELLTAATPADRMVEAIRAQVDETRLMLAND